MIIPVEHMGHFSSLLNEYRRIITQELNFLVKNGQLKIEDSGLILAHSHDKAQIEFIGSIKLVIEPNDNYKKLEKENLELKNQLAKIQSTFTGADW